MDEYLPAPFDGQTSDPYDGLGETEYFARLHVETGHVGHPPTWPGYIDDRRDADVLGDPDQEYDRMLDREMGI